MRRGQAVGQQRAGTWAQDGKYTKNKRGEGNTERRLRKRHGLYPSNRAQASAMDDTARRYEHPVGANLEARYACLKMALGAAAFCETAPSHEQHVPKDTGTIRWSLCEIGHPRGYAASRSDRLRQAFKRFLYQAHMMEHSGVGGRSIAC